MLPSTSTGLGVKNDLNINVQRTVVWVFNEFWNNEAPSSTHPLGARRRSRSRDRDRRRASPPPADWRGPTGPTGPTDYRPPPTEWAGMAGFAVRKMWFFWFVYFLCLCMPCGELQFCVVILSNKCFFFKWRFCILDWRAFMYLRYAPQSHMGWPPPQRPSMYRPPGTCHVGCSFSMFFYTYSSWHQATAHGMCLPRGNLWTGVHQQGHQARTTQQLPLHCWQELIEIQNFVLWQVLKCGYYHH